METLDASAGVATPAAQDPNAASADTSPFAVVQWTPAEVRGNGGWALLSVGALVAIFGVLRLLPSVGWPLVLAGIFAYLLDPVVVLLARRGLSRSAATGVVMGAGLLVGIGVVLAVLPVAVTQATKLPAYLRTTFDTLVPRVEAILGRELPANYRDLASLVSGHTDDIIARVLPNAGTVVGTLAAGSLSVLSVILSALIIPVVGFYLLRGWPNVLSGAEALIPARQRPTVRARMAEVDRMLGGFIRGQLTMAFVLSVLYSGALSIIGLKLAIVVGLVTGIGNLVPYVGTSTGLALAAGFCLVDFGVDYHLALVFATYGVLLALDGVFITPRVVGDKVGLSPAAVIVAVLACGSLFGFAGVLLAVPSAAILKLVLRVSVDVYRHSRFFRET